MDEHRMKMGLDDMDRLRLRVEDLHVRLDDISRILGDISKFVVREEELRKGERGDGSGPEEGMPPGLRSEPGGLRNEGGGAPTL
jgi:hypothetical protein